MLNTTQFAAHPIHAFLEQNIQLYKAKLKRQNPNETLRGSEEFFLKALTYIQSRLSQVIKELIDTPDLDGMLKQLQTASTQLRSVPSGRGPLETFTKNALKAAMLLPVENELTQLETLQAQKIEIERLRTQMSDQMKVLESKTDYIQKVYDDYASKLNQQIDDARKMLSRVNEDTNKTLADNKEKLQRDLSEQKEALMMAIKESANSADSNVKNLLQKAQELLLQIAKYNDDSKKLLGNTSGNVYSHGYGKVATEENRAANWFRGAAIAVMTVAVLIVVVPILQKLSEGKAIEWLEILYKVPSALVIFAPAAYLASEASNHRKIAAENKRIQLELATMSPFIDPLGEDRVVSITDRLADRYFVGHTKGTHTEYTDENLVNWISKLLEKCANKIGKNPD